MVHRNSFTWLFSVWLALGTLGCESSGERLWPCLPPIFDGGRRLHEVPAPSLLWLPPLLRQHEVCWRAAAREHELRVFLYGSSGIFGFPLPAEQSVASFLNERLAADGIPAHAFNLAFVMSYQLKDALIIHQSLAYRPDAIVYAVTLTEFTHVVPGSLPGAGLPLGAQLTQLFMENNWEEVAELAAQHPSGLEEPLQVYASRARALGHHRWIARLRHGGALLRAALRSQARAVQSFLSTAEATPSPEPARQSTYDCTRTKRDAELVYRHWQDWNILVYLQQIQTSAGIPVIVINWPILHQPVDDCYNLRYPNALMDEYNRWLTQETRTRGLAYADLHTMLAPDEFIDTLHVTAVGQRRIANWLARAVEPVLSQLPPQHERPGA